MQFFSGHLEIPTEKNGHPQSMEMVPLMPRTETKDSVITLDYVSMFYIMEPPKIILFTQIFYKQENDEHDSFIFET